MVFDVSLPADCFLKANQKTIPVATHETCFLSVEKSISIYVFALLVILKISCINVNQKICCIYEKDVKVEALAVDQSMPCSLFSRKRQDSLIEDVKKKQTTSRENLQKLQGQLQQAQVKAAVRS